MLEAMISGTVPGNDNQTAEAGQPGLQAFIFALFFVFGGITSLNDVIIPKLKDLFTLSYAEALLVQSAFFAAYFLISIPAALIVRRVGYMRGAVVGLLTMTAGCVLFVPASASATFGVFLFALFVLASGITVVQVVANPLISLLGSPATAHSRLTFAQAFNSLGTTIFPYVGSILILGSLATVSSASLSARALDAHRSAETKIVVFTYLGLAAILALVAVVVWWWRNRLVEKPAEEADRTSIFATFDLLQQPRFSLGVASIFLYVGAEVAVGSLIVNYLTRVEVLGLSEQAAGKHVPFYWGGAMLGRFVGAWLLRVVAPAKILTTVAIGAMLLIVISTNTTGAVSAWSLLAIGLMNSIMFPTIFSLASEGLGPRAAEGSGIICMAIVGGAIIPPLTGYIADIASLRIAMAVPALCYLLVACYGLYARRAVYTHRVVGAA